MKAAIYARYSSTMQREESIEAQVRACKEYIKQQKWVTVIEYVDRAFSARSDQRPEFQRMIKDAKLKKFDVIVIHKLDRFSRDRYDHAIYKRELRQAGVKLVSVMERIDDSPEGVILESMLEGFSEYYSRNLAREVMKGLHETALQCKHTGGVPPLGYNVDADKHYVINEREAEAVRYIYNAYLRDDGYSKTIDWLNENGIEGKRGSAISKNSLHDILRNEKYTGTYIYNRSAAKDAYGRRNGHKYKNDSEIIRIEGGIPSIISRDVYTLAMKKMKKNRSGRFRAIEPYLLTGLLFCGKCDGAYVGSSRGNARSTTENPKKYYECTTKKRTRKCDAGAIARNSIENAVLSYLETLLTKDATDDITNWITNNAKVYRKNAVDEIKIIKTDLKKATNEANTLLDKIMDGMDSDLARQRLANAEDRKLQLELRLSDMIDITESTIGVTKASIKQYLAQLKGLRSKSREEQTQILNQFIDKIEVFPPDDNDDRRIIIKTKLVSLLSSARIETAELSLRHRQTALNVSFFFFFDIFGHTTCVILVCFSSSH